MARLFGQLGGCDGDDDYDAEGVRGQAGREAWLEVQLAVCTCICVHVPRVLMRCAAVRSGGEGGLACQVCESFESVPCRACLPACLEFESTNVADACCKPCQTTNVNPMNSIHIMSSQAESSREKKDKTSQSSRLGGIVESQDSF